VVTLTVEVPARLAAGDHDVRLEGAESGRVGTAGFAVTAAAVAATPTSLLGADGVRLLASLILGGVTLAVALGLVVAVRRQPAT
jgi:hypothetical protein